MATNRPTITVLVTDILMAADVVADLLGARQVFTVQPTNKGPLEGFLIGITEEAVPIVVAAVGPLSDHDMTVADFRESP